MAWYYAVAQRELDLQNPTSPEKIRHVGELLRLGPGSRVLDVACGMGGPAMLLAATFGCRIVGVERAPDFVTWGRERIGAAGLSDHVEIVEGDASAYPLEPEAWDAALCLGATFVFDDLAGTVAALMPTVKPGGYLAVGEPFWNEWPLPREVDDRGYLPLEETVERFTARGLALTGLVAATLDDWDRYRSLQWRALEEYLAEHDDAEMRRRYRQSREEYLQFQRRLLGWAIFVGRKPD